MSVIIPAILTDDVEVLRQQLSAVAGVAKTVQIDVSDGLFTPAKTIGPEALSALESNLNYQIHLMVKMPEIEISRWAGISNIKTIIFHLEATADPKGVILTIKKNGWEPALAISPQISLSEVIKWAGQIDKFIFLAVKPGQQGQKFIPEVLAKVEEFKKLWPSKSVQVDGGLHEREIRQLAKLGIEELAVGSEIFAAANPARRLRELQEIVNNNL